MGRDMLARYPTLLDVTGEEYLCVPYNACLAGHPLITPSGTTLATSRDIPAESTTLTTSALGL